ncbi:MAG: adenosylmethionine decarboxylase [Candidatus Nealsonbacteria bacterium]
MLKDKAVDRKMIKKTKRSIQWVNQWVNGKKQKYAGIHIVAEFWGSKIIEDSKEIEKILITAAEKGGNTPLEVTTHKFLPQGITGVVLLAESHIALHAWPEYNYLAIDIFTCGEKAFPDKSLNYLRKKFNPKKVEIKKIKRGTI